MGSNSHFGDPAGFGVHRLGGLGVSHTKWIGANAKSLQIENPLLLSATARAERGASERSLRFQAPAPPLIAYEDPWLKLLLVHRLAHRAS